MLVNTISVGFGALVSETNRLDDVADQLETRVRIAETSVHELLGATWSGPAATAFEASFEQWDQAASDCLAVLIRNIDALRRTAADFAAAEQANSDTSRRMEASLPTLGIAELMSGR